MVRRWFSCDHSGAVGAGEFFPDHLSVAEDPVVADPPRRDRGTSSSSFIAPARNLVDKIGSDGAGTGSNMTKSVQHQGDII